METNRILVTGGSGFIGQNLVKELRSRGHEVIASDLLNNDLEDYVRTDVRSYRQLERTFEEYGDFDYVARRNDFLNLSVDFGSHFFTVAVAGAVVPA